ncbi:MAG: hypothetical protein ACREPS_02810 [Rhodanobacteraceae bacterium]
MKAEAAQLWIKEIRQLGVPIAIDAVHVTRRDGRNHKIKAKPKRPLDPKSCGTRRGTYWLRFSEVRRKLNRHRGKTHQLRSRTQATVTWLVDAVLDCTGGQTSFDF